MPAVAPMIRRAIRQRPLAIAGVLAATVGCHPSTRAEAERAAADWLQAMHLQADGVACGEPGESLHDNGYAACAVRFGGSTQTLWCTKRGCKMDAGFALPAPAPTTKITEMPR